MHLGSDNWGAVLTHFHENAWVGYPCPQVRQTAERVVEDACHPVVNVIASRLVSSEGQHMEKRGVRQGPFFFDGIGSKHHQGHRLQAPENRASNRRLAGLCSFGFDWRERPGRGGHCTTVLEESDGK